MKPAPRSRSKPAEASQPGTASQSQPAIPAETGEIVTVEEADAQLQEAAIRKVNSDSAAIIEGLAKKAVQGNTAAARLLVEFMRGKKEQTESNPANVRSDSLLIPFRALMTGPEWEDQDKSETKTAPGNN